MNRRTVSALAQHHLRGAALGAALFVFAVGSSSCASISVTRDTLTSGTFESKAFAVTLISWDIPKPAVNIARDNASDARLTNMQIKEVVRTPDLGWWDWVLDIIGMRWATVTGTWGFTGDEVKDAPAK